MVEMEKDEYENHNLFWIIPKASYTAQDRIQAMLEYGKVDDQFEHHYDNFVSEVASNIELQTQGMGEAVKYVHSF